MNDCQYFRALYCPPHERLVFSLVNFVLNQQIFKKLSFHFVASYPILLVAINSLG